MERNEISALTEIISKNVIFGRLGRDKVKAIAEKAETKTYLKGEAVRNEKVNPYGICFIISGTASVAKGKIVISTLSSGDIFGAADLYRSGSAHLTDITAASECRIAVISKSDIDRLISTDPAFAESYISYLSDRIAFLTGRIGTVTGGTAAEHLKKYIMASEDGCIDCSNMSLLAKKLDMGRATLYRAVDALESDGIITRKNSKIILIK